MNSTPAEPSSLRLVASMTIAGLLSGLILVVAYQVTKPRIEANEARALQEAVFKVLPGTEQMEALVLREGRLDPATPADKDMPTIYVGRDGAGTPTGYAIPAQGPGFQDVITLIFGFDPERKIIVGMQVLLSKETPGLGDKIFKDAPFQENFGSLAVEPAITPVPHGTKTQPHEMDCITGATISSKAVARILAAGVEEWLPHLPAAGAPPAEPAPPVPPPQEVTP